MSFSPRMNPSACHLRMLDAHLSRDSHMDEVGIPSRTVEDDIRALVGSTAFKQTSSVGAIYRISSNRCRLWNLPVPQILPSKHHDANAEMAMSHPQRLRTPPVWYCQPSTEERWAGRAKPPHPQVPNLAPFSPHPRSNLSCHPTSSKKTNLGNARNTPRRSPL